MNVIEELKLMREKGYGDFFDYAMEQKEIWEKKLHIIKSVNAANEIVNAVKGGFFKENGVTSVTIQICYKNTHYCHFEMYQDKDTVSFMNEYAIEPEPIARIKAALNDLHGLDLDYIGSKFNTLADVTSPNIRDEILNMLLSKDLKTILDFSELQFEVKDNEVNNQTKKPKL